MFLYEVENFIKDNNLFSREDKILLALSGGCDSVVLFDILKKLNCNFAAAHANFKLRGKDSDDDEIFTENLCKKNGIELFKKSFDTRKYAKTNKLSLEDAARKLRYEMFYEIADSHGFTVIATAHHLNDRMETFFINLSKGTGIKGLRSIQPKKHNIVRPLLFAPKHKIELYCKNEGLSYRTDKSNFDTYFLRNKFRHSVLPVFFEVNPKFAESMSRNFKHLTELEKIYNEYVNKKKDEIISYNNNLIYIDINKLTSSKAPLTLLYEIIHPYGFSSKQSEDILNNLKNLQTGKIFYSAKSRLLKDRNNLIISTGKNTEQKTFIINKDVKLTEKPVKLSFEIIDRKEISDFKTGKNTAFADVEKIKFPLKIRTSKTGDFFFPFGMRGKKLLSDFFTDMKLNLFEKEKINLLTSADDNIIWIIGYRTDDRYKISENTKKVLKIKRL
ncbi:MAG: tRNA lysidine(34) synthetase TilS [Chlorobi bacterium]|nr:tRNA lysidine(34) synthetase TilS [Chlorobiota bacterium]